MTQTGKVAIVTGASRGIGATMAARLAGDGFAVVINYSGDAVPAEALARKIEDKGGRALTAEADVRDPHSVRGVFDATQAAFGGVDILVNNAGIMTLSSIAETSDAAFERQVNVNLKGTFNTLAKPPATSATTAASSTSRRASSASCSRPMASMPRPRPPSRR